MFFKSQALLGSDGENIFYSELLAILGGGMVLEGSQFNAKYFDSKMV